ncbi:MAG TPA: hypothetical protein DDY52_05205 [Candidatus Moranbacteria bacterium]|nr:hypothetical protein [Candidatus Moranbacteria bacterium]
MKKINELFERLKMVLNKEQENPFYEERDEWVVSLEVKVGFFLAFLCIFFMGAVFLSELNWNNLFKFVSISFFIACIFYFFVLDGYKKRYGYFPWDKRAP